MPPTGAYREIDVPLTRKLTTHNVRLPDNLAERLVKRLTEPLPGRRVQARLQPELGYGRHFGPPLPGARQAAVLILLYQSAGEWVVPLTLRPTTMAAHAGQISFPGGSVDDGETVSAAARRELEEELGVPADSVELIGALSPLFIYGSNFVVTPWIAVAPNAPKFHPNEREVAEVIEVPLGHLLDSGCFGAHYRMHFGISTCTPHFAFERHRVWGATAMILAELLAVITESLKLPLPDCARR